MAERDAIFALSSAPGRAGIAVFRVSGKGAREAISKLTHATLPPARKATLRTFFCKDANPIDQGLVVHFQNPSSYTGEDVIELHVHGGRAIRERLSDALTGLGLRPADPGEFTRRAVENGKFDLTQAEAIADLIDAETEAQRRQALSQYEGTLAELYESWRERLVRLAALAEAAIDFSDEELPDDLMRQVELGAEALSAEIELHLGDARRGEILREGLYITVIGPPNAGKSSLVNALAQRDVAIVAETAGTTRDVIEVRLDLGGYPVIVADTAGLRETADGVESEGVRRALERSHHADLVLFVLDGSDKDALKVGRFAERKPDLVVWNKADLPGFAPSLGEGVGGAAAALNLSLKTSQGLGELVAAITEKVRRRLEHEGSQPPLTRARHRHALQEAHKALARGAKARSPELAAEDIRLASRAIGRITGAVDVEEVLDAIFREFCIGK